MRTQQDEVDTQARKLVAASLPRHFEHRDLTGRDYGVDLSVEIFDGANPTGKTLLLQIKGTDGNLDRTRRGVVFDLDVSFVKYALLFSTPFILCICPVNANRPEFRYVWIQEYVRVVLCRENPDWKSQRYVRFTLPEINLMPGREGHLSFVAGAPRRQEDFAQLVRIVYHLNHSFLSNDMTEVTRENFESARRCLIEASNLRGLFNDPAWPWGQSIRTEVLEPAQRACDLGLRGGPFSIEDMRLTGMKRNTDTNPVLDQDEFRKFSVASTVFSVANKLLSTVATANDFGLKYENWEICGDHDF